MLSLWEVLKTSKGLPAPDGFTALFAHSLSNTYTLAEISGIPPLNLGEIVEIVDYTIEGNIYQSENVSPDTPQEVKGCGNKVEFNRTNITIIGVESSTNYAYFDISAMPNAKVNDVVNILVANTEYQLRVKKISGSYIYVENKVV